MIAVLQPVLWVGRADRPELLDLRRDGVAVEREASFFGALQAIAAASDPSAHGPVVFVEAGEILGRESEQFAALRSAGARAVIGIYPPPEAWRADRAEGLGADLAITLPAWPGLLAATARRFSEPRNRKPTTDRPAAESVPPGTPTDLARIGPPTAEPRGGLDAAALESIVGDVAVLHRSIDDVDRVLDLALQAFARRSASERCSILLYDRLRTNLWLRRSTVLRDPSAIDPILDGRGIAGHVASAGAPLRIDDVNASPFSPALRGDTPRDYRTPSCLVLPLRGSEGVVGVVCFADKRSGAPYTEADATPLAFYADRAGQAIENAQKFRHLQELASIDELTGLANRRQFQVALEREMQRARRYDRPLSLAILDLDHFKQFNDICGHQAGDRALAAVGEILRTSLREVDVVARYGGEEFAVILPETAARGTGGARNPFPFLERLRRRIEEAHIPGSEKLPTGKLTVSGGVACFPDDASTADDLVREADRSLYVSKSRGRNTITYRGQALVD